jgi:DNA invertase Pin-like site-specific DNA recombinase
MTVLVAAAGRQVERPGDWSAWPVWRTWLYGRMSGLAIRFALAILKSVRVTTPGSPADRLDWAEIEARLPHPPGAPTRIAGYVRRSTDMEEQSLRIQQDQIARYVAPRGWRIDRWYADDALSGRSHKRPELRRLQHDVKAGLVDVVIIDRIDRLYRNLLGLLRFVKLCGDHDVLLISVSEGVDFQSQWGKLTLFVLGGLAEIYVDKLAAETRKGKRLRASEGYDNAAFRFGYCNGRCSHCTDPNGFDYCPLFDEHDRGDGRVKVPHPVECLAVHLAFALYGQHGFSFADIATFLNDHTFRYRDGQLVCMGDEGKLQRFAVDHRALAAVDGEDAVALEGILEGETFRFRTKGIPRHRETRLDPDDRRRYGPGAFDDDAIRTILRNRFYVGETPYAGSKPDGSRIRKPLWFDGKHRPLVSRARFERCQRIRRQRGTRAQNRRQRYRIYPLSGLLHCARHRTRTFRVLPSQGYLYYESKLCNTKIDRRERHRTAIRAGEIEEDVLGFAGQLRLPEAMQDRILAYLVDDEGLEGVLRRRQQVYERMRRARKLYTDRFNPLSQEEYDRIVAECRRDLETMAFGHIPQCTEALPYLEDFSRLLDAAMPEEQNRLLRHLLAAVYVDPDSGEPSELKVYPPFQPFLPDRAAVQGSRAYDPSSG